MNNNEELNNHEEFNKNVPGKHLIHNYTLVMDTPCYNYCIGCGGCDCFEKKYAVYGFKQIVRSTSYYCIDCDNKLKNSFFGRKGTTEYKYADKEEKSGYIEESNGNIQYTCNNCKKIMTPAETLTYYDYNNNILCACCGNMNSLTNMDYERCESNDGCFYCAGCESKYKIIISNNETIHCDDISKLKKLEFDQYSFSTSDSTPTKRKIIKIID